ncbi:hypothetical protein [Francisella salimarina]|uniref:Uncharacterized protein n=1 Tax=Francisella salimarina TaxID=2599927 RepID=A0AAJ4NP49_9GAMM|nr:hypothetical protein [Francisella salimarina]QWU99332.1 hypothetical protein KQR59_00165 [Francisella salimarina]
MQKSHKVNRYFFSKCGAGNRDFKKYVLDSNSPSIFINYEVESKDRESFLAKNSAKSQGKYFFECSDNLDTSFIISIYEQKIYIMKPISEVQFAYNEDVKGYLKHLPIKIMEELELAKIPSILAGIMCNRHYSSGTFREIKNFGNIQAIKKILGQDIDKSCYNYLDCLGSVEFETLIAKIFEEKGFYVPAYRGGYIKDYDLIAKNISNNVISIFDKKIKPNDFLYIQVKLKTNKLCGEDQKNILNISLYDHKKILKELQSLKNTYEWLKRALSWIEK